jgi:hypothetical protein
MRRLFAKLALWLVALGTAAAQSPFAGEWALTLPSGEAGWLAVQEGTAGPRAELLWAVGSAKPVQDVQIQGQTLRFRRSARRPGAPKGEMPATSQIVATLNGDRLELQLVAEGAEPQPFSGKRLPPLPPAPDLSRVTFGEPIRLFNGVDLQGWRVTDAAKTNGWRASGGTLRNDTPKTDFSAYGDHANLRTEAAFEDFELHVEFRLPPGTGGNSGLYLRGLYEVQVTHRDSAMQGISGPGALFGRITPTTNAGKPAGEWESYDITLVDRHVTVFQNGVRVIDNLPVAGPTGGALHADVTAPGPLMLQGDHTAVEYRNLLLRPRVKP